MQFFGIQTEPIMRFTEQEYPMASLLAIQELPTLVVSRSNATSDGRSREAGNGSVADIEPPEGSPARGERGESNHPEEACE
jgi:hypothetical protein